MPASPEQNLKPERGHTMYNRDFSEQLAVFLYIEQLTK
jgi:hypothetical protein